jgi:deazaflavin-dependent oxidoreductase (nitroreductase family)
MHRLEKVATRQTLRLTNYGRKSGKPYEVTIWFVVEGDRVFVGTANVARQWVRNVQKNPKVGLAIGSERFEGKAFFLNDQARHKHIQALMLRKYWMYSPILVLGRMLMGIGLLRDHSGSFEVILNG